MLSCRGCRLQGANFAGRAPGLSGSSLSTGQVHHSQRRVGVRGDPVGDVCAVQGAALQPPHGRAGHREHGGVLPQPGQAGKEPKGLFLLSATPIQLGVARASPLPSPPLQQSLLLLNFSPVPCLSSPFSGLTAPVFLSWSPTGRIPLPCPASFLL